MTNAGRPAQLLNVAETAKRLKLGINLTYRLIAGGEIQSIRIGKHIRVTEDAVEAFIAARSPAA